MKKLISLFVLVLGLFGGGQAYAGIPVIDVANLAQAIQQVTAWAQQYQQMEQQFQQLQQQYAAITGGRGFSQFMNDPSFQAARRTLPQDAQNVLSLMNGTGSYGNFASSINAIKQATSSLSDSDFANQAAAASYDADLNRAATNNALSMQAYSDAAQRLGNLETLIGQISQTNDPKAIAELQARIAAENGIIQNEHAKLQAAQMLMASEQQLQAVQARQASIQMGGGSDKIPNFTITP